METLISMQDIRTSLKSVADRAEHGESFIVVRNSKPAFKIIPMEEAGAYPSGSDAGLAVAEMRERFMTSGAANAITEEELDHIIHEVHNEQNKRPRR